MLQQRPDPELESLRAESVSTFRPFQLDDADHGSPGRIVRDQEKRLGRLRSIVVTCVRLARVLLLISVVAVAQYHKYVLFSVAILYLV